jgi:predicted amidophosphoribosyltransferase
MVINNTFLENYSSDDVLVLIDDVLTSGAHLSVALQHLRETFGEPDVMGIFWARSQHPSDFQ